MFNLLKSGIGACARSFFGPPNTALTSTFAPFDDKNESPFVGLLQVEAASSA